ncbi:hypothetical protein KXV85_003232, partial [Aspergillus fumigatus]
IARGTPNRPNNSSSQSPLSRLSNCVREALLASVACAAPPVMCHKSQLSTVPARMGALPSAWSISQRNLLAENRGSRPRPLRRSTFSPCPASRRAAQKGAVRRHCHRIQGPSGAPLSASQSSTDSRWLEMPMARISASGAPAMACRMAASALARIPSPDCSAQPDCGWETVLLTDPLDRITPASETSRALVLVVPESRARRA